MAWRCPYCRQKANLPIQRGGVKVYDSKFNLLVETKQCENPDCHRVTATAVLYRYGFDAQVDGYRNLDVVRSWDLMPSTRAKPLPDFVPEAVRHDYQEACAIESLSPKASATLSRRCLQTVVREFFGVPRKRNLKDEIDAAAAAGGIGPDVVAALHALRDVGAVGAHPPDDPTMIVDVEPEEATAMIDLLEILIDETYVARAKREATIARMTAVGARLTAAKNAAVAGSAQTALAAAKKA